MNATKSFQKGGHDGENTTKTRKDPRNPTTAPVQRMRKIMVKGAQFIWTSIMLKPTRARSPQRLSKGNAEVITQTLYATARGCLGATESVPTVVSYSGSGCSGEKLGFSLQGGNGKIAPRR